MADIDTYVMTSGRPVIKHDPNSVLDYTFNWTRWLAQSGNDTLAAQPVFILDASLNLVSSSFTATTATVYISGGAVNTTVPATCRITTVAGRIEDRTIYLKIVDR